MYKEDVSSENIDLYLQRLKHDKLPKPVCQFTINMEFVEECLSIADASKNSGVSAPDISNAANNKVKTAGGYIWIFSEQYQKMLNGEIEMRKPFKYSFWREIYKFSLNGEFLEKFENATLAGKSVGVTLQAISSACRSKSHICKGYIWRYATDVENEVA